MCWSRLLTPAVVLCLDFASGKAMKNAASLFGVTAEVLRRAAQGDGVTAEERKAFQAFLGRRVERSRYGGFRTRQQTVDIWAAAMAGMEAPSDRPRAVRS